MQSRKKIDVSYFPGCSLATTAKENNQSLHSFCDRIGVNLIEVSDWNCCGSSSTHHIDHELTIGLGARNLSLVPSGRPLLVACPNCNVRLREAHHTLKNDEVKRNEYENRWGRPINQDLEIISFFDLIETSDISGLLENGKERLKGLNFVSYYGCMLAQPSALRNGNTYHEIIEKMLFSLGANPIRWSHNYRCCGTYLSVAKPDLITPIVNNMVKDAIAVGADCIVTACSMCHLNLEIRCNLKKQIPTMHFSEILSIALGETNQKGWFYRHLVDPTPLLQSKGLLEYAVPS